MNSRQVFNPFLPSWEYIPDGEPHVFGDRLYLFGSHDRFNGTQFCMNDYVCWSCPADDLSDWRLEGTIYRKVQDPAAKEDSIMQAPDVCRGSDGRYYLYYTLGMAPFMSVAVCDTPAGKYEYYGTVDYPDGTPVGCRKYDLFQFDPGVFVDDNGRIWLYSGFGVPEKGPFAEAVKKYMLDGAYCMELYPDMRTIKSGPKKIFPREGTHGFYEASSMRKIDGRYYFIYSSVQQHELCWAVGEKPDEPFSFGGTLVSNGDIGISNFMQNYTGNTHGSLVRIGDSWYVFYHRQTNRHQYSRQACAEKLSYRNGRFYQAEMTSCGLNDQPLLGSGEYEARIACHLWSKEGALLYGVAETPEASLHPYFTQTGEDREGSGDQYIANFRNGSTAGYKYFEFHNLKKIGILLNGHGQGEIVAALKPGGDEICRIAVDAANDRQWFYAEAESISGVHSLYFTYHGDGMINLYRICFQNAKSYEQ